MMNYLETTELSGRQDPTKRQLMRVSLFLAVFEVLIFGFEFILAALIQFNFPEFLYSQNSVYILSIVPTYLFALPVSFLIIRKVPETIPVRQKIPVRLFLILIFISFGLMRVGNVVGTLTGNILDTLIKGGSFSNPLNQLTEEGSPLIAFLCLVVLGPIGEELVFRKLVFGRLLPMGELTALLLSSLFFGLYHGNLYQCFYGFALGCLLSFAYSRSGNLLIPILIHAVVNLFGAYIPLFLPLLFSSSLYAADFATYAVFAFTGILSIAGIVLFIMNIKKAGLKYADHDIKFGQAFKNPGVLLLLVIYAALFTVNLLFT